MLMRFFLISRARILATVSFGTMLLGSTLCSASLAQPFPGKVFGCSVPSAGFQDDPSGLGTQKANALIVTPDGPSSIPVQGNVAIFSQVGRVSGQGRCINYRDRLNSFNIDAYASWVFDVGISGAGYPAICFRPPDGYCGTMYAGLATGGALPAGTNSYEVFPLATGQTAAATALDRLTSSLGFADMPIID